MDVTVDVEVEVGAAGCTEETVDGDVCDAAVIFATREADAANIRVPTWP